MLVRAGSALRGREQGEKKVLAINDTGGSRMLDSRRNVFFSLVTMAWAGGEGEGRTSDREEVS